MSEPIIPLTDEERLSLLTHYLEEMKTLDKRIMDNATENIEIHIDILRLSGKIKNVLK